MKLNDNISSFNPENSNSESINELDTNLLNFMSLLKIPSYFMTGATEIIDSLRFLIKKEINFAENYKRVNRTEENIACKNSKYDEMLRSCSRRLNIQIGMLKQINNLSVKNFEETSNINFLEHAKLSFNTILEVLDKSTESDLLSSLLKHLQTKVKFLSDNEDALSTTNINKKQSILHPVLNLFNKGVANFDGIKFENSLTEKLINNLLSLLRKKQDDDELCRESNYNI